MAEFASSFNKMQTFSELHKHNAHFANYFGIQPLAISFKPLEKIWHS